MEPTTPDPLTPQLREAESLMEEALGEACAAPPASKADTGELVRVEEMLEIATDAARRTIALRRKRRDARKQAVARRAEMGAAEAAATAGASHRTVTDDRGVTWDVFAVYPEARLSPHSQLRGTFQQGWLCFDSAIEKRRLSPIPESWKELGDEELARLADQAEPARRRSGSHEGEDEPGPRPSPPAAGE